MVVHQLHKSHTVITHFQNILGSDFVRTEIEEAMLLQFSVPAVKQIDISERRIVVQPAFTDLVQLAGTEVNIGIRFIVVSDYSPAVFFSRLPETPCSLHRRTWAPCRCA